MADLVGVLVDRDRWVRELRAESVTTSGESLAEVLERLEQERPESPRQLALRVEHENDMQFRRLRSQVESARRSATGRWTALERRLGQERLALAVSEMYPHKSGKVSARSVQMEGKTA